jgi:signal transduction histidine kinase
MTGNAALRLALWPLTGLAAAATLAASQRDPGIALSAGAGPGAAALLLAGVGCAAGGLEAWRRRRSSAFGPLLVAVGLTWFLPQWGTPAADSSIGFTLGLVGAALPAPLVAHAVLVYPAQRLARRQRAVVAALYATCGVLLGLIPTLAFDPLAEGCRACPRNLLRLGEAPTLMTQATRAGDLAAAVGCALVAVLVVQRFWRASPAARRALAPITAAGVLFLGAASAGYVQALRRGPVAADEVDRWLWLVQCAALVGLAMAVAAGWSQGRRTRGRIARLVVELAQTPPAGGLRDVLARALDDPTLQVAYVLSDGRTVDAAGAPVSVDGDSTAVVRNGRHVAVLVHREGLLDDPITVDEVARTASLVLDNEHLQAELASQLRRLRASRQRIVAAGDAARRRLERDVHDGAQQRLVALLLDLRLARTRRGVAEQAAWETAEKELLAAIEELRGIALGIFPAVLADEGLAEAVDAFAEGSDVPVRIDGVPAQRFPAAVESASYFVVVEAVRRSAAGAVRVSARQEADLLRMDVLLEDGAQQGSWLQGLEDRVGAVDGVLTCEVAASDLRLRVEIPCAS